MVHLDIVVNNLAVTPLFDDTPNGNFTILRVIRTKPQADFRSSPGANLLDDFNRCGAGFVDV